MLDYINVEKGEIVIRRKANKLSLYSVKFALIFTICLFSYHGFSQSHIIPEEQISFAKEEKPLDYYVAQAGLWWAEIQKDFKNEKSWYNYYRANRNAQGTANWSSDFVNEGPNLMLGDDIVKLMGEHIPASFTYNFVRGSTAAVYPGEGEYLLKAYQMNPDFPGLLATVVTYATSTHDAALRQEANQRWFKKNEIPVSLMAYGYNTLKELPLSVRSSRKRKPSRCNATVVLQNHPALLKRFLQSKRLRWTKNLFEIL